MFLKKSKCILIHIWFTILFALQRTNIIEFGGSHTFILEETNEETHGTHTGKHNSWILTKFLLPKILLAMILTLFALVGLDRVKLIPLKGLWVVEVYNQFSIVENLLLKSPHSIHKMFRALWLRVNQANKPRAYWPRNRLIMGKILHLLI